MSPTSPQLAIEKHFFQYIWKDTEILGEERKMLMEFSYQFFTLGFVAGIITMVLVELIL
jgi:hypothetical protein